MNQLIVPELYCPFEFQVNQHIDVLEKHAIEWFQRFHLSTNESVYQKFCKSKLFLLTAAAYPNCELEELKIANDWLTWVTFLDDYYDVSNLGTQPELLKTFHNRFLEILNGSEVTSQDIPLSHALSDLRKRTFQRCNTKWFYFFVSTLKGFLDGCIQEARNRTNKTVPDIDTYIILRRLTGVVQSLFALIELCDHLTISDSWREDIKVQKLEDMANNIICWCNDIYSVHKEMLIGDYHNLVLLTHLNQEITLEQAMHRVVNMHDQELRNMMLLEKEILSIENNSVTELAKYISGIYAWIGGHYHWYFHSGRYKAA